ncbi:hypothetical protein, partial [Marinobacter alexandrii]|uniref:hypothetical protein n=1 Tax=Marinobacter alexandrii TaxID=2570351 RepID=UPI003296C131
MKKADLPHSLRLVGSPSDDVPKVMALFRSRIRLHSPDSTPDATIDHHADKYLPVLVNGEAATTMQQLQCETLEWRTDKELAELNSDEDALEIRA